MSKRIYGNEYGFQTRAVHTGNDIDGETGASVLLQWQIVMNYHMTHLI